MFLMFKREEQWARGAAEREFNLYNAILNPYQNPHTADKLDQLLKVNRDQFSTGKCSCFLGQ